MNSPSANCCTATSTRDHRVMGSSFRWTCHLWWARLVSGLAGQRTCISWLLVLMTLVGTGFSSSTDAAEARKPSTYRDIDYSMSSEEARTVRILEAVTALWFLAIGSCVGSFLNVVIYRAPLGMDIVLPKSRCPRCQSAIIPRDNIPIIGWLRLRGKCRQCQLPISARYPLVELGMGLLFLIFLFRTLLSGGESLPVRDTNLYRGVVWILWYTKWDLLGIYLFHMVLLSVLWSGALMEYDGHLWPRRIVAVITAVGIAAVSLWPPLHPVPFWGPDSFRQAMTPGIGVFSGVAGLLVSGVTAHALSRLIYRQPSDLLTPSELSVVDHEESTAPQPDREIVSSRMQFTITLGLTGLFVGWQTGIALALVTAGLLGTHPFFRKRPVATTSSLVTLLLFVWRPVFHGVWPHVSSLFIPA